MKCVHQQFNLNSDSTKHSLQLTVNIILKLLSFKRTIFIVLQNAQVKFPYRVIKYQLQVSVAEIQKSALVH